MLRSLGGFVALDHYKIKTIRLENVIWLLTLVLIQYTTSVTFKRQDVTADDDDRLTSIMTPYLGENQFQACCRCSMVGTWSGKCVTWLKLEWALDVNAVVKIVYTNKKYTAWMIEEFFPEGGKHFRGFPGGPGGGGEQGHLKLPSPWKHPGTQI